jgi:hypothetical protein
MKYVSFWSMLMMLILDINIGTNIDVLSEASGEDNVELNTARTKYVIKCRHQNIGHNHNIMIGKKSPP